MKSVNLQDVDLVDTKLLNNECELSFENEHDGAKVAQARPKIIRDISCDLQNISISSISCEQFIVSNEALSSNLIQRDEIEQVSTLSTISEADPIPGNPSESTDLAMKKFNPTFICKNGAAGSPRLSPFASKKNFLTLKEPKDNPKESDDASNELDLSCGAENSSSNGDDSDSGNPFQRIKKQIEGMNCSQSSFSTSGNLYSSPLSTSVNELPLHHRSQKSLAINEIRKENLHTSAPLRSGSQCKSSSGDIQSDNTDDELPSTPTLKKKINSFLKTHFPEERPQHQSPFKIKGILAALDKDKNFDLALNFTHQAIVEKEVILPIHPKKHLRLFDFWHHDSDSYDQMGEHINLKNHTEGDELAPHLHREQHTHDSSDPFWYLPKLHFKRPRSSSQGFDPASSSNSETLTEKYGKKDAVIGKGAYAKVRVVSSAILFIDCVGT